MGKGMIMGFIGRNGAGQTTTLISIMNLVHPDRGEIRMQDVNTKLFSKWLPAQKEYECAAGYCVEMYDASNKYPKGTEDENYYAEIWIPVKKK